MSVKKSLNGSIAPSFSRPTIALLTSEFSQKLCLLFVGSMQANFQEAFQAWTKQISQSLPVQIISQIQYLREKEIQSYFQIN